MDDGGGCGSWRRAGLGVDCLAWLRKEEAGEKPRRGGWESGTGSDGRAVAPGLSAEAATAAAARFGEPELRCQRRMRQKGGGFSELPRRQLALADQRILHRLRQAAEKMSIEEGVSVRRM